VRRWRDPLLLALLLVPYFVNLGRPDLWDANESLYAEPPREALETGEWLAPTMNYEPWFVKPPGVTWVTLPFYALLGPSEFAGRLPMALAAAVTLLCTWRIGVAHAGRRAGLLAAAVLATTAKQFLFSRQLAGDVFLTTCVVIAVWGYLEWFAAEGARRRGLWIAAAALGAGTLMKGPVILGLVALALFGHLWAARRCDLLRRLRPAGPALLLLAIAVPWFVYMTARYGAAFPREYFWRHHVGRFFTGLFGDRGPLFYPLAYLGDALPWSVSLPGAIWMARRAGRWRAEPWCFSLVWCAILLVLFTLSTGKRTVYLLPLYPFAALLVGATLAEVGDRWERARWIVGPLLPVAVGACAAAVAAAVLLPRFATPALLVLPFLVAWVAALAVAFRRRRAVPAAAWTCGLLAAVGVVVAAELGVMQEARPARELAERVAAEASPGDVAGRYYVGLQSLPFYAHRPFFSLRDPEALRAACREAPQAWVVLPADRLADFDAPDLAVEVVLRRPYLQVSLPALLGDRQLESELVLVRVRRK